GRSCRSLSGRAGEVHGVVEAAYRIEVAHQRGADLVGDVQLGGAADALDLDVLALDRLDVGDVEAPEQVGLDLRRGHGGGIGLGGEILHHALEIVVLAVHRKQLHRDQGEEAHDHQDHHETHQGDAVLLAL